MSTPDYTPVSSADLFAGIRKRLLLDPQMAEWLRATVEPLHEQMRAAVNEMLADDPRISAANEAILNSIKPLIMERLGPAFDEAGLTIGNLTSGAQITGHATIHADGVVEVQGSARASAHAIPPVVSGGRPLTREDLGGKLMVTLSLYLGVLEVGDMDKAESAVVTAYLCLLVLLIWNGMGDDSED